MIRNILIFCLFFLSASGFSPARRPVALVWNGKGACPEDCAKAAANVARRAGLAVVFVKAETLQPETFVDAVLWVQPGGDAVEVARALSPEQKELIRGFVKSGGGYLGFCAGAFLTDRKVDDANTVDGLALISGTTYDYKATHSPAILPIRWPLGAADPIRSMYFEDGAYFEFAPGDPVTVLATYPEGQTAAIQESFGRGRVVVSGVHPEAPKSWKDSEQLQDPDGSDFEYADQMIRRALGR